MKRELIGLTLGFVLGWGGTALALAPTTVTWDGSACPAGVYTVETTARGQNGDTQVRTQVGVTLPQTTFTASFANLLQQSYTVSARVLSAGALVASSATQTVTGLGDALPVPSPTPTPTVTPTPTPSAQQSPDCTKATVITITTGPLIGVYGVGAQGEVLKNGVWFRPGTITGWKWAGGKLYEHGSDGKWYELDGPATGLSDEPTCQAQPTPTPTPTSTPTPSPTPPVQGVVAVTAPLPNASVGATFPITVTFPLGTTSIGLSFFNATTGAFAGQKQYAAAPTATSITVTFDPLANGVYSLRADASANGVTVGFSPSVTVTVGPVTPTPTPTPAPISDLSQILAAMQAQTQQLLAAIMSSHQPAPAIPTIPCTIVSMGSYANGDQKPTLRCPPSGLANGQAVKVIK